MSVYVVISVCLFLECDVDSGMSPTTYTPSINYISDLYEVPNL